MNADLAAKLLQLANDIGDFGVAQVRTILLERESQHDHFGARQWASVLDELLQRLLRNVGAHAVVDSPPRQNDLRMVSDHFCLMSQVIGVDADAMAAHQAGPER